MTTTGENLTVPDQEYDQGNEENFRFELQDIIGTIIQNLYYVSNGSGMQSMSRHAKLKHVLPPVGVSTYG